MAIDKETELGSIVIQLKDKELSPEEYVYLIPRILKSIRYTGDRSYCNPIGSDPQGVLDLLFKVFLPRVGYSIRDQQICLSQQMLMGLQKKVVSICEAEVGTGKTMAALAAAICARKWKNQFSNPEMPVTYVTSSIELQKAIIEKEIPLLSNLLMEYGLIQEPLRAVLRKGKEHYFCPVRYDDLIACLRKNPEKHGTVLDALEKLDLKNTAFDLDRLPIPGFLKNKICVSGSCSHCSREKHCRYASFIGRAMCCSGCMDIQVTNQNLFLMSCKHPGILLPSSLVIMDEAHKVRDAAQDVFGIFCTEKTLAQFLKSSNTMCSVKGDHKKWHELRNKIQADNADLFAHLTCDYVEKNLEINESGESELISHLDCVSEQLIGNLIENLEALEELFEKREYRMLGQLQELQENLESFLDEKNLLWTGKDENNLVFLHSYPFNVGETIRKKVWENGAHYILTSGTMGDGRDFGFFKHENGLDRIAKNLILETTTPSPFDYVNHTRLYIPNDLPYPENGSKAYLDAVSDRIVELIHATNGHTAILFTSYQVLHDVYERTADRLSEYQVIRMSRSNRTAVKEFKKSSNAVLFAAGSMWEGVDCPGDVLSSVIIVRLPFPMRTPAMEQKKQASQDIGHFIKKYAVPEMLIKLRQGAGRLIRTENDTGLLSILDARAASGGRYQSDVLETLKKYPLITSLEQVKAFFDEVKDENYKNS